MLMKIVYEYVCEMDRQLLYLDNGQIYLLFCDIY